jgi:DNA ligase-1
MQYSKIVEVYEYLENTPARLKKIERMAELLKGTDVGILVEVTRLLEGRVFPSWSEEDFGIASLLMMKIIQATTGYSEKEINETFKKTGDLGLTAEKLISGKKQKTLFGKALTVEMVFENLRKLASVGGKGSQERKFSLVAELISQAKPGEAKYIVRTILKELRIGVASGVVRDSITRAFLGDEDSKEAVKTVEWAWFVRPDYGEIARIAKERGMKGLRGVKLELGKPFRVLLAEKSPSLEDALNAFEKPVVEYKYDGMRAQIHRRGERIWIFTRRMEDVTTQFPDLVDMVRKNVKPGNFVIEGEVLAIDRKTGKPLAFQSLSQRIQRKYEIERMVKEIPIQINLFDVVYLEGELFGKSMEERRGLLRRIVKESPGRFQFAKFIRTRDVGEAGKFYEESLKANQEGVMVKNLEATYHPGRRVAGGWLKVKPTMENLDLVIIGAVWGTGKRVGWMGSFILGCRDDGDFRECGMIGTGIKEKDPEGGVTFEGLTRLLKPHIESEKGSRVEIKPMVVVEVAYEEIQRSPTYSSGYALRFPRVVSIRRDRSPDDIDSIERIDRLYQQQRGKG